MTDLPLRCGGGAGGGGEGKEMGGHPSNGGMILKWRIDTPLRTMVYI